MDVTTKYGRIHLASARGDSPILSQLHDLPIDYIDKRVVEIDNNLHGCVKSNISIFWSSTEGGSVTYYYDSTELQKLKEEIFSEMDKTITNYFYDHGNLIYVRHELFEYNRPMYWDKKQAMEAGDAEEFDPKKTAIHLSTYYFVEQQLIYWRDKIKQRNGIFRDATQAFLQGSRLQQRSGELIKLYTASPNNMHE